MVANIAPKETAEIVSAWENGEINKAQSLFVNMTLLCQAMFYETNSIPVKTALAMMGKCTDEMNLPLTSMSETNLNRLKDVLRQCRLIS